MPHLIPKNHQEKILKDWQKGKDMVKLFQRLSKLLEIAQGPPEPLSLYSVVTELIH